MEKARERCGIYKKIKKHNRSQLQTLDLSELLLTTSLKFVLSVYCFKFSSTVSVFNK